MITIIHGPQGCGKTRNAMALANFFGASLVVDLRSDEEIPDGALVLCNLKEIPASLMDDARVMSFNRAMELVTSGSTHA